MMLQGGNRFVSRQLHQGGRPAWPTHLPLGGGEHLDRVRALGVGLVGIASMVLLLCRDEIVLEARQGVLLATICFLNCEIGLVML